MLVAAAAILLRWSPRSRHTAEPSLASQSLSADAQAQARIHAGKILAGLPLIFEPNQGQASLDPTDHSAQFVARGPGFGLALGNEGAILTLARPQGKSTEVDTFQMKLAGANPAATISAAKPLPGKSNYLIGNIPANWHTNVPQYAQVGYDNVYSGVNLVFYGNQGQLEYDFQVAPGSDPSQAELEFDGARQLKLQNGDLVIEGHYGSVRLGAPRVYQEIAGTRQPVEAKFVLHGPNRAGFSIAEYDRSRELIIDPVLALSTYFGGSLDELNSSIALDGSGNIYLAGSTNSTNLPIITGVFQSALAAGATRNVYIAKITPNASGPFLAYVTYLGGNGTDTPVGIAVDGGLNPYVAGTTTSTNFPFSGTAYQTIPFAGSTGTNHAFVTRLTSDATILSYSSYLSGNGDDFASGMTIDSAQNLYVTGTTTSTNAGNGAAAIQFPASASPEGLPFQQLPAGPEQFFVTKVNTQASAQASITYSTYFGGGTFVAPVRNTGGGIAVDTNGNIYFSGTTNMFYVGCAGCGTTDFPIKNAYQPCLNTPTSGNITVQPTCPSTNTNNTDAFIAKLNPLAAQGTAQLLWSTFLGGAGDDSGTGVAVDTGAANFYLTGTTNSQPVTTVATFGSFQLCLDNPTITVPPCPGGTAPDAFAARFTNPSSTTITNIALTYFSYLGGSGDENGLALTVDNSSGAIVSGWTDSTDFPVFPTSGNLQNNLAGGKDAFLARLNTSAVTGQNQTGSWATYFGGSGDDEGTSVALDSAQNVYMAGDTTSPNLHLDNPLTAAQGGSYNGNHDAFVVEVQSAASLGITGQLTLGNNQTFISAGNPATFTYTITNSGPDLANAIVVTDDISVARTQVPVTFQSASISAGTCTPPGSGSLITCTIPSLQAGSTATLTIVLVPTPNPQGGSRTFNGGDVTVSGANNITPASITVPASMSDFGIQVGPNSFTVPAAGQSASYQVLVTPNPVYSTSVTLGCTGLPTGASCIFSPTSVTPIGTSPSSVALTISTTARPVITPAASLNIRHFYAVWLAVPGLAFVGIGFGSDRRRRRVLGVMALCAIGLLLFLQPACSHTSTQPPVAGTPAGTYTITVTGNSGTDAKSQAVQLVVP